MVEANEGRAVKKDQSIRVFDDSELIVSSKNGAQSPAFKLLDGC
jgi:hypothetical protein